jgi:hypothetical protein
MPSTRRKTASKRPTRKRGGDPDAPISPVTGLPTRAKVHLPIKGYGRLNAFQVLEQLYGHSPLDLKRILDYESLHQNRRMVTDRITDLLRRLK